MTNYKIARKNNNITEYFGHFGQFHVNPGKILSFRFRPVLHALNIIESGNTNVFLVKSNGIEEEVVKI